MEGASSFLFVSMSDISMEKKLELVQQIRSQYHKNQYDMQNREQILYGRSFSREGNDTVSGEALSEQGNTSFKLRFAAALALLAGVILLDMSGRNIAGISMDKVFQAISTDYYKEVEEFVETLADTAE